MGIVGRVDHKDLDGTNCRRDNLRAADASQNSAHRSIQSNNTSGYKGVHWHKPREKWRAQIRIEGRKTHLGLFSDPIEAARAHDLAALRAFGEFAVLNFPDSL
jgi:hypothetical protein